MKTITHDDIDRLADIKEEIKELVREAQHILRGTSEEDRAHSYWAAHIKTALDDEHSYMGRSMITMQDTIESLAADDAEKDEPDEPDILDAPM